MENTLKLICRLLVFIAVITCFSICLLGSKVLYPKNYGLGCGVIDQERYEPKLSDLSLPDSVMKRVENGKMLFEANCASCHAIHSVVVGPALKDIEKRRTRKWIRRWVKNPAGVIASGDKYAVKLAQEYKWAGVMSSFRSLTNKEIDEIVEYCKVESTRSNVVY